MASDSAWSANRKKTSFAKCSICLGVRWDSWLNWSHNVYWNVNCKARSMRVKMRRNLLLCPTPFPLVCVTSIHPSFGAGRRRRSVTVVKRSFFYQSQYILTFSASVYYPNYVFHSPPSSRRIPRWTTSNSPPNIPCGCSCSGRTWPQDAHSRGCTSSPAGSSLPAPGRFPSPACPLARASTASQTHQCSPVLEYESVIANSE